MPGVNLSCMMTQKRGEGKWASVPLHPGYWANPFVSSMKLVMAQHACPLWVAAAETCRHVARSISSASAPSTVARSRWNRGKDWTGCGHTDKRQTAPATDEGRRLRTVQRHNACQGKDTARGLIVTLRGGTAPYDACSAALPYFGCLIAPCWGPECCRACEMLPVR